VNKVVVYIVKADDKDDWENSWEKVKGEVRDVKKPYA